VTFVPSLAAGLAAVLFGVLWFAQRSKGRSATVPMLACGLSVCAAIALLAIQGVFNPAGDEPVIEYPSEEIVIEGDAKGSDAEPVSR